MSQAEDANRTMFTPDSDTPCAAIKELWGEEQICPYKPSFCPPNDYSPATSNELPNEGSSRWRRRRMYSPRWCRSRRMNNLCWRANPSEATRAVIDGTPHCNQRRRQQHYCHHLIATFTTHRHTWSVVAV